MWSSEALMPLERFISGALALVILLTSSGCMRLFAQEKTAGKVAFCELVSQPNKYDGTRVTVRVRVKEYRHGTTISDQACPKQSLLLIADQTAVQAASLSHFYDFVAEHRRSSKPILAIITGRLVRGEDGGFVLKQDVVFKLESVLEISEGD